VNRVRIWHEGEPVGALAAAIDRGAVVAIPTESSYGLAVDPRDAAAVARVMALKGRDAGKPLPVVVAEEAALRALPVDRECEALRRFAALWPAPLSLLLPLTAPLAAAAGEPSVAVRVPAHPLLRRLLAALGRPLTATSANLAGDPAILDPTAAAELLATGGEESWLVDGGMLPGGLPSTLVAVERGEVRILRVGRFPSDRLLEGVIR
jgi:L-threonylcarbamoyladenylate synthase